MTSTHAPWASGVRCTPRSGRTVTSSARSSSDPWIPVTSPILGDIRTPVQCAGVRGMGFDRGVTADLVDLPALRSYLVAHAVPGLDEVVLSTDGASVHRRLVAVDGAEPVLLTVALPSGDVGSPTV